MSRPIINNWGGQILSSAAIVLFHRKASHDERVSHFFEDADEEREERKEQALLSFAFDHPSADSHEIIQEAQADLVEDGLDDNDLDAMVDLLDDTLHELGVPDTVIADAIANAESKREELLCGDWVKQE